MADVLLGKSRDSWRHTDFENVRESRVYCQMLLKVILDIFFAEGAFFFRCLAIPRKNQSGHTGFRPEKLVPSYSARNVGGYEKNKKKTVNI